jgi:hypothetical protein
MTYSTKHLHTAGKITVYTTIVGVFAFAVIFLLNLGNTHNNQVSAQQTATTSVTVLNTPPAWTVDAEEEFESSAAFPTNVGEEVSWVAIGTDANSEPYYLLICDDNATPTANAGAAPACDPGATQWAVSTSTVSGTEARAATTTLVGWSESNPWFAWICDDNVGTPRCSTDYRQGSGTTTSPFEVNHRPSFTIFSDDSPAIPGAVVTFMSTSTDADTSGAQDTVRLFVCSEEGFDTVTDTCSPGNTLASTTVAGVTDDASATYTVTIPTQDQDYEAWGYVIDNHGFEATGGAQNTDSTLTVDNVAPTVGASTISINDGSDLVLSVESGETTGFTLQFTTSDNNSCEEAGGGDEITGYDLSLYRSGVGSTTCDSTSVHNANNCYPSDVAPAAWNLSCTASTTSCTGPTDVDQVWDCTFPLWYIADPTDGTATSTQYPTENWLAQVRGIDDDAATGPFAESDTGVDVTSLLAFALNTLTIPYGVLEPGQQTDPLVATTTIAATGNVGLDKDVQGESMCTTYTGSTDCPNSASSTINADQQRFSATTSASFASATALSSTTPQEIEVNVHKTTATSTPAEGSAYWGINVPISITFSGDYTGENTITARVGESEDWD